MKCWWNRMPMCRCETAQSCTRTYIDPTLMDGFRAHDIRAIRKGRVAAGIHAGGLGPTEHDLSGDFGSFVLQASRLRAAGPRDMGPGRLHSYQRGLSWSRQVAGST